MKTAQQLGNEIARKMQYSAGVGYLVGGLIYHNHGTPWIGFVILFILCFIFDFVAKSFAKEWEEG